MVSWPWPLLIDDDGEAEEAEEEDEEEEEVVADLTKESAILWPLSDHTADKIEENKDSDGWTVYSSVVMHGSVWILSDYRYEMGITVTLEIVTP